MNDLILRGLKKDYQKPEVVEFQREARKNIKGEFPELNDEQVDYYAWKVILATLGSIREV